MKYVLLFLIFNTQLLAMEGDCSKYLPEDVAKQQAYMKMFFNQYKEAGYENSKFSMLFDKEYLFTRNAKHENNDVVSFGSGPDALRPLIDFPNAKRYHLVDLFRGWGKGPLDVFFEITRRLHNSWPGAKVEITDWGFLNQVTPEIRDALAEVGATTQQTEYLKKIGGSFELPNSFWESWMQETKIEFWRPWKMTVSWSSEEFGEVSKDFFIHPHNFNEPIQREWLFKEVKTLAGVVVTGITAPDHFEQIMNKMIPGGALVLETYDGFPADQLMIASYEKSDEYDVKLVEAHAYLRYQAIEPTMERTYVVFKK
ncbi:MAG: hypothetical protein JNM93_11515 [Bacteriovoracaceae bacterium]|nr:hypothetical protein [Bacteriovoracaceae bacterium]